MYTTYLIRAVDGTIYIGMTEDVQRRLREHNQGKVQSTRGKVPWRLIYFEAFLDRSLAREREKQLKRRGAAYQALMKRIS